MARARPRLTPEDKDYLHGLLDHFGPRLQGWITDVADGRPSVVEVERDKQGNVVKTVEHAGVSPDPAEATKLVLQFIEFVRPRLSRVEKLVEKKPATREQLVARARELGLDPEKLFRGRK